MLHWRHSTKIAPSLYIKKTWPSVGGAYFPYISVVKLYQDCSSNHDSSKNMTVRGWGLISLYIYIRHFKNHFVNITAELFLWWPSFNIHFKPSWCMKKTWPLGCRAIKFIQKSESSELGLNFNSKFAKLFAQVSDIRPSWSSCLCNNVWFSYNYTKTLMVHVFWNCHYFT